MWAGVAPCEAARCCLPRYCATMQSSMQEQTCHYYRELHYLCSCWVAMYIRGVYERLLVQSQPGPLQANSEVFALNTQSCAECMGACRRWCTIWWGGSGGGSWTRPTPRRWRRCCSGLATRPASSAPSPCITCAPPGSPTGRVPCPQHNGHSICSIEWALVFIAITT